MLRVYVDATALAGNFYFRASVDGQHLDDDLMQSLNLTAGTRVIAYSYEDPALGGEHFEWEGTLERGDVRKNGFPEWGVLVDQSTFRDLTPSKE